MRVLIFYVNIDTFVYVWATHYQETQLKNTLWLLYLCAVEYIDANLFIIAFTVYAHLSVITFDV